MDIELLSKMVRELVLAHDSVALPGLGVFVATEMPAAFSDRGYTILPPYRKLSFMSGNDDDGLLVDLYARSNNLDKDSAKAIVMHYVSELKDVLKDQKTIVFPGLGRMRATRQNAFFFIQDEDADIFPEGFGLPPVSLKTHTDFPTPILAAPTPESIAQFVSTEPVASEPETAAEALPQISAETGVSGSDDVIQESAAEAGVNVEANPESAAEAGVNVEASPESAAEAEVNVEASPESAAEAEVEADAEALSQVSAEAAASTSAAISLEPETPRRSRWWIAPLVLIAVAIFALATFMVLAQVMPDFIDSILYTPEELRIINY